MNLRTTLWATVLALGCANTSKDTDPTTTGGATSGETTGQATTGPDGDDTTDGPATTGDPSVTTGEATTAPATTGGPPVTTGEATTGAAGDDTTSGTDSDSGGEPSPECVLYCDEFMPNCSAIPDVEVYDDLADCLTACASFAHGADGEFMGDTVECRIAHLTFDPEKPPGYYELHCFHAQEHPTANCV
jgi:hypothetical protein